MYFMLVSCNDYTDVYVIVKDLGPVLSVKIICSSPKDENNYFTERTMVRGPLTILKHVP